MLIQNANPKHRTDIDGLRAIAVLLVMLYHFNVGGLTGGYIGVDVFFVISGYLVGNQVIDGIDSGRFSLITFYEKRALRLFPALFFCMASISILSIAIFIPADLREYGKTLLAANLYVSNIYFYRKSGYFDEDAINKPLLHTWSLSVEEQFYIILPIVSLIVIRVFAKRQVQAFVFLSISGISLLVSQRLLPSDASASFYLIVSRVWEFAIGILALPLASLFKRWGKPALSLTSLASLAMIIIPAFAYGPSTPFPGLTAVPPCIGTATLIAIGAVSSNPIVRFISSAPMRGLGLSSYSLYLWHWPIFVGLNYLASSDSPGPTTRLIALAAAVGIGLLSWRYVELPSRRSTWLKSHIVAFAVVGSGLLGLFGIIMWKTDGLPQRLSRTDSDIAYAAGDFLQSAGVCDKGPVDLLPGLHVCVIGSTEHRPSFLVWGDSHARALRDGLDQVAREEHRAGLLIWQGGCPPLFNVTKAETAQRPIDDIDCAHATNRLRDFLKSNRSLKSVLLIGRWPYYTEGRGIGRDQANHIKLKSTDATASTSSNPFPMALHNTVLELERQDRRVFILRGIPEIPNFNAKVFAKRVISARVNFKSEADRTATVWRKEVEVRQRQANDAIDLSTSNHSRVISISDYFCRGDRCSAVREGRVSFFDNNHLTVTASREVRAAFRPFMRSR